MAVDYVKFIRRATVPVVREYLLAVGVNLIGVDDSSDPAAMASALEQLAHRDQWVWTVFQEADAFGPRHARAALRSVLVQQRGLLATFDGMTASNRECALWLAATSPVMFEQAVSSLNTSNLVGGRSWDGFRIVSSGDQAITPKLGRDAEIDFEARARVALNASKYAVADGKIKAVPFKRLVLSEGSHSQRAVTQITVYAEGPQESRDKISEANEVHSEVARRVDEGAVIYDPKLRTIEVVVLGGARVRRLIADAFCQAFLPPDVEIIRLVNRDIDFTKFSGEPEFPLQADSLVEDVAVDEIRYSLPDSGGALITFEKPYSASERTNIYNAARGWPQICPPEKMSGWEIVAVRLRFLFKGDGRIRRVRTLELKKPNRSNLREKSDSDHAVMHNLLERWRVFKDDPNAADAHN